MHVGPEHDFAVLWHESSQNPVGQRYGFAAHSRLLGIRGTVAQHHVLTVTAPPGTCLSADPASSLAVHYRPEEAKQAIRVIDRTAPNGFPHHQESFLAGVFGILGPELPAQVGPKHLEQPIELLYSAGISGPNSVEKNGPG
jgi:hypothetical protein